MAAGSDIARNRLAGGDGLCALMANDERPGARLVERTATTRQSCGLRMPGGARP